MIAVEKSLNAVEVFFLSTEIFYTLKFVFLVYMHAPNIAILLSLINHRLSDVKLV